MDLGMRGCPARGPVAGHVSCLGVGGTLQSGLPTTLQLATLVRLRRVQIVGRKADIASARASRRLGVEMSRDCGRRTGMESVIIVEGASAGRRLGRQSMRPQQQQAVTVGVSGSYFAGVRQESSAGSEVGRRVVHVYGEALERLAED
jgi:hypothetical protein